MTSKSSSRRIRIIEAQKRISRRIASLLSIEKGPKQDAPSKETSEDNQAGQSERKISKPVFERNQSTRLGL